MSYAVGSLVEARGREWVVLPESDEEFLVLRPLGGTDQEVAGVYLPLEGDDVRSARCAPPDPSQLGDYRSTRLLRDAIRLGFRNSAGPFRSFARIAVEPRPYQLVPLLMALRLDPVRMLIADDVGIGKTIEAGLMARELLDRGEIQRMAVLCPPHLAEQWQSELAEKFHIQAELVLSSTIRRLERNTSGFNQSVFDLYPFVIVSTEYIKSTRRREEFVRTCPEFVIVDEAHTCAFSPNNRGGRHLRHQLVQSLAQNPRRHLVLVTATPHSGDEGAFRSLLGLLRPDFLDLPEDLSGRGNEGYRREVAQHLVQRRRADVRAYMDQETVFPTREDAEETYRLTPEYQRLFATVLEYARERVMDASLGVRHQRVAWWSALALLRSLASSPAAAAATLRTRSGAADTETVEDADAVGESTVLDLDDAENSEYIDVAPGSQEGDEQPDNQRRRLLDYARRADDLRGPQQDAKLAQVIRIVKELLKDGFNPILFCRFIPTAEYVAEELRQTLPNRIEVAAVTGTLPPPEREQRIARMGEHEQRVLVATDCLSEGINLQQYFDAVVHYDLSWNPTRHEQREGRVDRFGQPSPIVRTLTFYGLDNQIDGIVLDVLLRKHKTIRTSLGISVPLPANTSDVVQALLNGLVLRGSQVNAMQMTFDFLDGKSAAALQLDWDNVSDKEKRSRTLFAQQTIQVDEVFQEYQAMRTAIGTAADVEQFVRDVVNLSGGYVEERGQTAEFHLPSQQPLIQAAGNREQFAARFSLPVADKTLYLTRTHPLVEGLAAYALNTALDPLEDGLAKRASVIRTSGVTSRVTLLLLRYRFHILTRTADKETPLLAEACEVVGYRGRADNPQWLEEEEADALLRLTPEANVPVEQAIRLLERTLEDIRTLESSLNERVEAKGQALLEAHRRVRSAARHTGVRYSVQPQLPADVLGVSVLLPVVN
jgi:superfamily II DNA or RNA helicase